MNASAEPGSIFAGTANIIQQFFALGDGEHLKQKSTARRLASNLKGEQNFEQLLQALYAAIESNWSGRTPSKENWRIERQIELGPNNRSPEVLLERAIAILGERGLLNDWFNQIPVASGLVNERSDKRAAIDLMRYGGNKVAFVELKWASDTPIFAAFEILLYGLAFIFSAVHRKQLSYQEQTLLDISELALEVLAPRQFFDGYDLTGLQQKLDNAVRSLSREKTKGILTVGFEFLCFPREFDLPFANGADVLKLGDCEPGSPDCLALISGIRGIEKLC